MTRSPRARAAWVAAVIAVSTSVAAPVLAQPKGSPDPKALAEAKSHMEAGAAFYNDPSGHKCEEAIREFSKAYDLSGSKKALRAMGVCALELERDGEAIGYYEKYLAQKDVDAADRTQVETDLKALKAAVAHLTLRTDRPNTRITAVRTPSQGLPITNHYTVSLEGLTVGIHPGQYTFTASAEDSKDITWQVEIQNGGSYNKLLEFEKGKPVTSEGDLTPPKPGGPTPPVEDKTERPIPPTVWIFGGLTVAAGGATIGLGVTALQKKKDYDKQNGKADKATLDGLRSKVTTFNAVTDVMLGVTIASAAATTIFALTRPTVHKKADKTASTSWTLIPAATPAGGGAFVVGSF
jgi:hypothetical protein